jgi:hypothetical protein
MRTARGAFEAEQDLALVKWNLSASPERQAHRAVWLGGHLWELRKSYGSLVGVIDLSPAPEPTYQMSLDGLAVQPDLF